MKDNTRMDELESYVKETLSADHSGHGYAHALRVRSLAEAIQEKEGGNRRIISASALVHDTIDSKLFANPEAETTKLQAELKKLAYTDEEISAIITIITHMSWHLHDQSEKSLEAKIVEDADRLEALGAIGLVRTIEYGASKNRSFYEESNLKKEKGQTVFAQSTETTLSHFYDKLLKLEGTFQTPTGEKMAKKRADFLRDFLKEFYRELDE
jgi:uncharacterized protein